MHDTAKNSPRKDANAKNEVDRYFCTFCAEHFSCKNLYSSHVRQHYLTGCGCTDMRDFNETNFPVKWCKDHLHIYATATLSEKQNIYSNPAPIKHKHNLFFNKKKASNCDSNKASNSNKASSADNGCDVITIIDNDMSNQQSAIVDITGTPSIVIHETVREHLREHVREHVRASAASGKQTVHAPINLVGQFVSFAPAKEREKFVNLKFANCSSGADGPTRPITAAPPIPATQAIACLPVVATQDIAGPSVTAIQQIITIDRSAQPSVGGQPQVTTDKSFHHCTFCDFFTPYKKALSNHLSIHYRLEPFQCTACSFTTTVKHYLEEHEKREHGTQGQQYSCHICSFATEHAISLRVHILQAHHGC